MQEKVRVCRKCLLEEMDEEEIYTDLQKYIGQIPEEERTGEEEYRKRLQKCRECEQLLSGMCRICGCYVELRAAVRNRSCPLVHPKWQKEKPEE